MLKRVITLFISILPLLGVVAQGEDWLLECYLAGDMPCWRAVINTTDHRLSDPEKHAFLINALYGYIPATFKQDKTQAKKDLQRLEELIVNQGGALSTADSLAYTSAAQAYVCMLYHLKALAYAPRAFKNAERAVAAAPDNAIVLSVAANIYFYCPSLFGGDKKEALRLYLKAEKIMETNSEYQTLWNYPAIMLCIANVMTISDKKTRQ